MFIKKFAEFLNEENDMGRDSHVSAVIQEVDRNYHNYPSLSTVHLQELNFTDEVRDWPNFADTAELAKEKTTSCKFYLKFDKAAESYELQLDFDISYKGVENWDRPDFNPNVPEQTERLGVSLEVLALKKIQLKSSSFEYVETEFGKDLGKTVLKFLLNIFTPLFDMIGDEALIIRQL